MKTAYKLALVMAATALATAGLSAVLLLAPAPGLGQAPPQFRGGRFLQQLMVHDRAGNVLRKLGEPADYNPSVPALSPDGTRLAIFKRGPSNSWVFDLSTGAGTQVSSGPGVKWQVAWSPDGSQIVYVARRDDHDGLYRKASNGAGTEELLYRHALGVNMWNTIDWSADGRFLCFDSGGVLFLLPLNGDQKAVELVREVYSVARGRFFPNSRFLAYTSDESGRDEVYVRPFDPASGRLSSGGGNWQVSSQGGSGPFWSRDGRELFYMAPDGAVMVVEVTTTPAFKTGPPALLFRAPVSASGLGVSGDGQKFALYVRTPPPLPRVVTVAPEILSRYVGRYSSGVFDEDEDHFVTLEGAQLVLQLGAGRQKLPLSAISETSFFTRDDQADSIFQFFKDDQGVVTHLTHGGAARWMRK